MQLSRPRPPLDGPAFARAPDVEEWLVQSFIDPRGPLYRESLSHLEQASIGVLWVRPQEKRRGKIVAGKASLMKPPQSLFGWEKEMWLDTMGGFFGDELPDFLIRFWTEAALEYDDASWSALAFHELKHLAQDEDEFGAPKFNRQGVPVWCMAPHDFEGFAEEAEMFGAGALGEAGRAMDLAFKNGPTVASITIALACGTCLS